MDLPKYDGNIFPDEWINIIQKYYYFWKSRYNLETLEYLDFVKSLIDPTITLSTGIDSFEKLRNALKEDISFTVFKNTNKRKLQSLNYDPERKGGDTSKFISTFRKLCYNAEINDIEEQKKYLYKSLPNNHFDYISNEFYNKMKNVKSINELTKEFEDIILEESNLIRNESIVALKHVASGKYLSSINNLCYETGSNDQLVFIGSSEPDPNSLWRIKSNKKGLITYADTFINLQHVRSNKFLGISSYCVVYPYRYKYYRSPSNNTEVNLGKIENNWNLKHSKLENHQGYLKSNDIINLSIKKLYDNNGYSTKNGQIEFLRSHGIRFTVGDAIFHEVICINEKPGENDEWYIELIHEVEIL
ncbi:hypothetical protein GLOIN_2v1767340 [Rhizophagus clarus]|uniref:MIR domain-containing protein n=1 Tax=Rhizophagus clarus TaxID=94130 RepID=A0A8H3LUD2_9GLOM|nr:hypothetical protein GLOIN_2v1767340 [Rhizophagus clarus]